ncbi:hypothetical protein ACQHIV_41185 [Kribbella sp. GL6]|uniref:hypothetical protein n=1 Tax=Kribbella sp. GL6 TaxID=3419765 RepID=UPI003D01A67C
MSIKRTWLIALLAVLVAVGVVAGPAAFAAGNAASGDGTMAVSPTTVTAGSTTNQLVFTFTATTGKFTNQSLITLTVPLGWTAPTTSNVTASGPSSCGVGTPSIAGSGPWTITVSQSCDAGNSVTVTYGTSSNRVTAPAAAQTVAFPAASRASSSGSAVPLTAGSPQVTVTAGAASKLVLVQGPGNGYVGTALTPAVTVQLQDQNGNPAAVSGVVVTLTPSAGTISSGASATTAANGRATFGGVVFGATGLGLTLTASATGLASTAPSASFNITVAVSSGAVLGGSADDGTGSGVKAVAYYYCAGYSGSCTSANWTAIGSSTTANYQVTWTSTPAAGAYRVVAVSTDNVGNSSQPSAATPVTVS